MRRYLPLFLLAIVPSAWAADPVEPVNATRGVAIEGFDPVAYFDQARAVKGSDKFTVSWMGATWRFASQDHRDRFASAPESFAPQFGGYCSFAVSENYTAKIDPQAWKIVEGKLYLNYSKSVQKTWEKDQARRIDAANRNWPALHR